jgi:hypothetical protein
MFYAFNKCPEEVLTEIEKLVAELGLENQPMSCNYKRWIGKVKDMNFMLYMTYQPTDKDVPLCICTDPAYINYKENSDLLEIIKKLISITGSEVYNGVFNKCEIE